MLLKHLAGLWIAFMVIVSCHADNTWTDGAERTWSYYVYDDCATIKGVSPADGDVTIPSEINGVSVTSIGDEAFYGCSGLTSVTIPDSVTSIGSYAFSGCSGLEEITLPFVGARRGNSGSSDSLFGYIFGKSSYSGGTSTYQSYSSISSSFSDYYIPSKLKKVVITDETVLGYGAFYNCSGLTSVTIPDSVTNIQDEAFHNCSGLTSVTIPNSVTSIGPSAFYYCSGLTSITIPDSVTSIGDYAFLCCGLTSLAIPDSVTSIGDFAFESCDSLASLTIPDSVTSIGSSAFSDCSGLTSITIPDSVTSIGYDAFRNCYSLTNVTIGSGVTNIADGAFDHCESLTSVTIPDSVTSIGSYSFQECSGLTSITIPDSVTSIGDYAFLSCGLTSLAIPNSVTNIGREAFSQRYKYLKDITVSQYVCDVGLGRIYSYPFPNGITNLVFSDNVTSIGCQAFADSGDLASLTIPDSVTNIGDFAFNCCASLTNVTIGGGVASIGDFAFESCDSLASLTIPDSVTSIGYDSFRNCYSLTNVTIGSGVTNIADGAFSYCDSLTNVTFLGNAPDVGSWPFGRVASGCVAAVSPKSTGWGVSVGEDWNGLTLQCWPEVLTAAADDAEVCGIVATFADKGLASKITTVDEYEDFKAWVDEKNLYQPAVVDSLHAEAAYLLGAERLFENEPTVEIGEVVIAAGESAGTTKMTVAVTIKDGEKVVAVDQEKVAAMFEATGDLGDWNGAAKLTPTVTTSGTDASGKMTFVVTPGDGTAAKAFLRIRK